MFCPGKPQPSDVLSHRVGKRDILFDRIGVIKPKICCTHKILRQTEIEANGFSMPDMQKAVGLWWETRLDPPAMLTAGLIACNNGRDKIRGIPLRII